MTKSQQSDGQNMKINNGYSEKVQYVTNLKKYFKKSSNNLETKE
jgi:hypothetical protein